jgi:hypothetical protein
VSGWWTNEAAAFLLDVVSMALAGLEGAINGHPAPKPLPVWFPTLKLSIEIKKALPVDGAEWLQSRVTMKSVRNGRMDIDVILRDAGGEIVALATHIALVKQPGWKKSTERAREGPRNRKL